MVCHGNSIGKKLGFHCRGNENESPIKYIVLLVIAAVIFKVGTQREIRCKTKEILQLSAFRPVR
jgi:hypothetical protein